MDTSVNTTGTEPDLVARLPAEQPLAMVAQPLHFTGHHGWVAQIMAFLRPNARNGAARA